MTVYAAACCRARHICCPLPGHAAPAGRHASPANKSARRPASPARCGGLGLRSASDDSSAAHWASWQDLGCPDRDTEGTGPPLSLPDAHRLGMTSRPGPAKDGSDSLPEHVMSMRSRRTFLNSPLRSVRCCFCNWAFPVQTVGG